MPVRRFTRTAAVLAAAVLVAAACGNAGDDPESGAEDDGGTDAAAETVSVDAPGVTDTEIHVEGVASVTNPLGASYDTADDGVEAYFAMVNEDGGVHGRTLVLDGVRDDKAVNNTVEVKGIVDADEVFAVLPVATLLFSGADLLVESGIPTFGWTINPEWQGTEEQPKANLFGQIESFLCLGCEQPYPPYVAEQSDRKRVGLLAYNVPQSSTCLEGWSRSIEVWGAPVGAEVAFRDASLGFGTTNLSVQVQKMKEAGVDLVATCMDNNGVVTLAKEMKKQGLDAIQLLPNAYDADFIAEFGDLFEGSWVIVGFAPLETPDDLRPEGLDLYEEWIERTGGEITENSLVGWLNAALFVTGLREAGPDFDRAKVVDAINSLTDYTADGLLPGVNWKEYGHYKRQPVQCAAYLRVEDGKLVPTEQDRIFTCFEVLGEELVQVDREEDPQD